MVGWPVESNGQVYRCSLAISSGCSPGVRIVASVGGANGCTGVSSRSAIRLLQLKCQSSREKRADRQRRALPGSVRHCRASFETRRRHLAPTPVMSSECPPPTRPTAHHLEAEFPDALRMLCNPITAAEFDPHHASQDSDRIGRGGNRHRHLDSRRVGQAREWCGQALHASASSECRVAAHKSGPQVARYRHTPRRDRPKLAQQFRLQVQ
jgi:hypothetical protein